MNPLEIDHAVDSRKNELKDFREVAKAELLAVKGTIGARDEKVNWPSLLLPGGSVPS
jgi:hypothetical protein